MTLKIFALNMDSLGKFDSKSDEGIFVGYSTSSKAYRVYNKHSKVVEESIHVVFDETNPICSRKSCNDDDVDAIGKQIKEINLKEDNTKEAQDEKNEEDKHEEVQQTQELREPTFPRERSYVKELAQFERNKVWNLVSRPKDHPIIGTKWVFRNKLDENGIVVRNKARLVAKAIVKRKELILMRLLPR
ncbi:hypothetical protein SLEP1_g31631 [Rubroshorea leprosula]|uniref:Reverse transcriptase Ty1/copia-type domain-containing protein n=1 Tax=Rubroshorea leprosula TaxID=152421 RepID=A0AAV5KB61_9ROSI|nr:hypothetical protein SLEP1_g31631 [Rubroshorea leprosula]